MNHICQVLHELVWSLPLHRYPIDESQIPHDGIYVVFERGETGHGRTRIVRVGTHTGAGNLQSRLKEHFVKENKDRSIFRKNIGRALLGKDGDPFLETWNLDLTTRAAREKHSASIDRETLDAVERRVSAYIRENLSFCVFSICAKEKRLEMESKIISTVSRCEQCQPSNEWLGLQSPKRKIRESGMWLVNLLYKTPLSEPELDDLKGVIIGT